MKKEIKNIGASVKARLLKLAKKYQIDFNRMLLLYVQERFLCRLSKSKYKVNFILKGGLLMYGRYQEKARSTKDIDLSADRIRNKEEKILQIIHEIIGIEIEDGIVFDLDSVSIEQITERLEYGGFRIKLKGSLDAAVQILQIDIGFKDIIYPTPIGFEYPVLLEDGSHSEYLQE